MHVFLSSGEQKICCCTCLWLSLECSCLNTLSDCSNLQIESRTNQVCFIRSQSQGHLFRVLHSNRWWCIYSEYKVVVYTACLFLDTLVNCNRLLAQTFKYCIHSRMCAHVHCSQHLCSRSLWGSINVLPSQVASGSLVFLTSYLHTHTVHISIDIDWTWKCSLCCISELRRLPTFTMWYNEADRRGSRAGCQVCSHSPHTAALVPVGLCHCWLVLCPLQHLCSRSGEVLPSLTGSGPQVYLTSLSQPPPPLWCFKNSPVQ